MRHDNFDAACEYLLKDEGGYSDNPHDSGGPTKYGITIRTLSRWRGKPCTADDVKALELPEAKAIYRTWYWDSAKLGGVVDARVATVLLDACVLFGVSTVVKILQTALGALGLAVKVDGIVGPGTIGAVNAVDPSKLVLVVKNQLVGHVGQIVHDSPKNSVFQNGWLARVNRYKDVVA